MKKTDYQRVVGCSTQVKFLFVFAGLFSAMVALLAGAAVNTPFWPTSGVSFAEGKNWETIVQPTEAGDPVSGLFGSTRSSGHRFHEGIDIRAEERDARGHAKDRIFSILPGVVVEKHDRGDKSSYGRFVVIQHTQETLPVYSLYAHLASISETIKEGVMVQSGTLIGIMGNTSAVTRIPHERAHLHLEIGVFMTDQFQKWYDKENFETKNEYGNSNGKNLVGFNPLSYFGYIRQKGATPMDVYVRDVLKTDFSMRYFTRHIPDFVRRYPALVTKPIPKGGVGGWEIEFTWFGLPKRWTPLLRDENIQTKGYEILRYERKPMFEQRGRLTLMEGSDKSVKVGRHLEEYLEMLFPKP